MPHTPKRLASIQDFRFDRAWIKEKGKPMKRWEVQDGQWVEVKRYTPRRKATWKGEGNVTRSKVPSDQG